MPEDLPDATSTGGASDGGATTDTGPATGRLDVAEGELAVHVDGERLMTHLDLEGGPYPVGFPGVYYEWTDPHDSGELAVEDFNADRCRVSRGLAGEDGVDGVDFGTLHMP